jgi:hypothetical protein
MIIDMGLLLKIRKLVILTNKEIATDRALSSDRFPLSIEKNDLLMLTEGVKDITNIETIYKIAVQRGYLIETKMAPTMSPSYAVSVSPDKAHKITSLVGLTETALEEYNRTVAFLIALMIGAGIGGLLLKSIEAIIGIWS